MSTHDNADTDIPRRWVIDDDASSVCATDNASMLNVLGSDTDVNARESIMNDFDVICGTSHKGNRSIDASFSLILATLLNITHFTMSEMRTVSSDARSRFVDEKWKHVRMQDLESFMLSFCRNIRLEPEWHVEKRGDDRVLPSSKGNDLWGYLRRLYNDPEQSRIMKPDYVKRNGRKYNRYMELVEDTIMESNSELKRIYGDGVDLTPRHPDDVDHGNDDAMMSHFIGMLEKGNISL